MALNRNFNVQDEVLNLYPALRRTVLFSLVGSLNATLIQAADQFVVRAESDGTEIKEMSVADAERLYNGPETAPEEPGSQLHEMRLLCALAGTLREDLRFISPNDSENDPEIERVGSLYGTLGMMTGKQRARSVAAGAIEALKQLNIELTPEAIETARKNMQSVDQARADARARRRGGIEWTLENVFQRTHVGNDGDYWIQLPLERKELLIGKFFNALNGALTQAQQNVLFGRFGDNVLGLADIPMIRDTIQGLMVVAYPPSVGPAPKRKARRVVKEDLAKEVNIASNDAAQATL